MIRSNAIRRAAKGEECTLRLDCCNYDAATTALAHFPDESGGMGRKSDDIAAAFSCSACHDRIDGRNPGIGAPGKMSNAVLSAYQLYREVTMRRAQTRTLRRLVELGIVSIVGVK